MAGLLETLAAAPYKGRADLPALGGTLQLELDELLPLGEALQLVGFAVLEEGDILLTAVDGNSSRLIRTSASSSLPPRCANGCRWSR